MGWFDNYTTLGILKQVNHEDFEYFESQFLKYLHKCLTTDWWLSQGGANRQASPIGAGTPARPHTMQDHN